MKRIALAPLTSLLLFSTFQSAFPQTAHYDYIELLPSLGPLQMWQNSSYISADTAISPFRETTKNIEEFSTDTAFFNAVDFSFVTWQWLVRTHPTFFVDVVNEAPTRFSIFYADRYNHLPLSGYPKVTYWNESGTSLTVSLDLLESDSEGFRYGKTVALPLGKYRYVYTAMNDTLSSEYQIEVSSFVVSDRPSPCTNAGVPEAALLSGGRVRLSWNPPVSSLEPVTYSLYLGPDPARLTCIYRGTFPSHETVSLRDNTTYYWKIEGVNTYGVSSMSPLYHFATIAAPRKAFNYPNPFNPVRQKTNFVFSMASPGSAEITVFSEYGDIAWRKLFADLPYGTIEISYDGTDDNGDLLYNGTYPCHILKRYGDREEKDACRILVIK